MAQHGKALALDCEMVGAGSRGSINILARVSLVNENGQCLYDNYVKPTQPVTDYRTEVSGIMAKHLNSGRNYNLVQSDVARLIQGRIIVGNSIQKDLDALGLTHPASNIRDISTYPLYMTDGTPSSLKNLAAKHKNMCIQSGPHSSIEDAKAAMILYQHVKTDWEQKLRGSTNE